MAGAPLFLSDGDLIQQFHMAVADAATHAAAAAEGIALPHSDVMLSTESALKSQKFDPSSHLEHHLKVASAREGLTGRIDARFKQGWEEVVGFFKGNPPVPGGVVGTIVKFLEGVAKDVHQGLKQVEAILSALHQRIVRWTLMTAVIPPFTVPTGKDPKTGAATSITFTPASVTSARALQLKPSLTAFDPAAVALMVVSMFQFTETVTVEYDSPAKAK